MIITKKETNKFDTPLIVVPCGKTLRVPEYDAYFIKSDLFTGGLCAVVNLSSGQVIKLAGATRVRQVDAEVVIL